MIDVGLKLHHRHEEEQTRTVLDGQQQIGK